MRLIDDDDRSSPRPWGCFLSTILLLSYSESSPRPWGCFYFPDREKLSQTVFPTPVGVFLFDGERAAAGLSLPHARGGVSKAPPATTNPARSSPRPWGCFRGVSARLYRIAVFPTPVGVFLFPLAHFRARYCLPHARGGVSTVAEVSSYTIESSPRPWGCFRIAGRAGAAASVFPTPVGVFPQDSTCARQLPCLPHARGGVSRVSMAGAAPGTSSPRPWGCFLAPASFLASSNVFPTPVGVFLPFPPVQKPLYGLPHARGGVSPPPRIPAAGARSSPRPWGCFYWMRIPE